MKPVARKYRFDEVPDERSHWQALPPEQRLQAVVEMSIFWAQFQDGSLGEASHQSAIAPVAQKRPLSKPSNKSTHTPSSS